MSGAHGVIAALALSLALHGALALTLRGLGLGPAPSPGELPPLFVDLVEPLVAVPGAPRAERPVTPRSVARPLADRLAAPRAPSSRSGEGPRTERPAPALARVPTEIVPPLTPPVPPPVPVVSPEAVGAGVAAPPLTAPDARAVPGVPARRPDAERGGSGGGATPPAEGGVVGVPTSDAGAGDAVTGTGRSPKVGMDPTEEAESVGARIGRGPDVGRADRPWGALGGPAPAKADHGGDAQGAHRAAAGAGGADESAALSPGRGRGIPPEYDAYVRALRRRIQERLGYPWLAVRRGVQGSVELEVQLDAGGRLARVTVVGREPASLLRDAAIQAVRDATPFPLPPGLATRALTIRLPVVFELR